MKLFAVGISHKAAPVEFREQLAVERCESADLACYLKWFGHFGEMVLISTCNRVEIYGTTRQSTDNIKSVLQLVSSEPVDLRPYVYVHKEANAARHLFRVTAGLDSMSFGETEITGQVKNAYETARAAGLTGRTLSRLFQTAFRTTKEIRTHTGIGRGRVSIKSAAVSLCNNIDDLEAVARSGVQARERELTACHQIIEAHLTALINKLHLEDERCNGAGRSGPSHHPLELGKNIRYKLAIPSSLVVQPS